VHSDTRQHKSREGEEVRITGVECREEKARIDRGSVLLNAYKKLPIKGVRRSENLPCMHKYIAFDFKLRIAWIILNF